MRTCRRLGLRSIAVYSDADVGSLHVAHADEAYRLGPPPAGESYLNVAALLDIARRARAAAVHPGYGFLAENPDFAQACLDAGLCWIGPPPQAMRALGDKARAKALAEQQGVPLLPGYHGADQSPAVLLEHAQRIGFPVLIKASAGGGGRGMRVVPSSDDFADALEGARREARASFGDDRVLLERYVGRPRHVEVQILADSHGQVVHLGERECSIQRRHQKLIEESPSPAVDASLRSRMGQSAIRLARAAGYVNAGTVEYLLDETGQFAFLEVNARLQVEHPVTEAVTGLDLVEQQLRIAAG
ncbi:MAG: ATP-grasp domain-containing protein, partial [Chloroflexota bacterium]|nr:ATP-grasp domain-containing protein [Chloroflexota bacterium]